MIEMKKMWEFQILVVVHEFTQKLFFNNDDSSQKAL